MFDTNCSLPSLKKSTYKKRISIKISIVPIIVVVLIIENYVASFLYVKTKHAVAMISIALAS